MLAPTMNPSDLAKEVGIAGLVDIALMSALVYGGLVWLRRSRIANALRGALIIGGVYLVARQFNLALTAWALEAFFVVLLAAAIVIFRDELRGAVERVASWSRRGKGRRRPKPEKARQMVDVLAATLVDLARARMGALVVLPGRDSIGAHLEGGVALNGELSEPLLKSIFDPSSIGHDGAVVLDRGRVRRFSAHLPLSHNFELLGHRGTRHAAALGLSERTDAMCVVVSEERGEVSIAYEGRLERAAGLEELVGRLRGFVGEPAAPSSSWLGLLRRDYAAKALAVAIAVLLWIVLVHGSAMTQRSFAIPIEYTSLKPEHTVHSIIPAELNATFTGARRDFYFVSRRSLKAMVSLEGVHAGTTGVAVPKSAISFPSSLTLDSVQPSHVAVVVRKVAKPPSQGAAPPKKAPAARQR